MTSEKGYPKISGRKYYVKVVETNRKKRVTVYNNDKHSSFYKSGDGANYIVSNIKRRGRFWHFGKDMTPPIDQTKQIHENWIQKVYIPIAQMGDCNGTTQTNHPSDPRKA